MQPARHNNCHSVSNQFRGKDQMTGRTRDGITANALFSFFFFSFYSVLMLGNNQQPHS